MSINKPKFNELLLKCCFLTLCLPGVVYTSDCSLPSLREVEVGVVCGSDCLLPSLRVTGVGRDVVLVSWGVVWEDKMVSSSFGRYGYGGGMALLRASHSSSQPWSLATSKGVSPFCRN